MSEAFFYVPGLGQAGETLELAGDEARHAAARRLRAGAALTLFDGAGLSARAELVAVRDRGRVLELRVGERTRQPPPTPAVHLACALPKGDRLATLLDMATQLGMTAFTPLACEWSVVVPTTANADRMQRLCLEACKQSRRTWLPRLREGAPPAEVASCAHKAGEQLWVAHPGGRSLSDAGASAGEAVTILIGPEGGFSAPEVAAMRAQGAQPIDLGNAILRIETAAIALLAAARLCVKT